MWNPSPMLQGGASGATQHPTMSRCEHPTLGYVSYALLTSYISYKIYFIKTHFISVGVSQRNGHLHLLEL